MTSPCNLLCVLRVGCFFEQVFRHRLVASVALFLLVVGLSAKDEPPHQRGRLLRTETVRTDHTPSFQALLSPSTDNRLHLFFREIDLVTHHDVPIYEVVIQVDGQDANDITKVVYQTVPGEVIRGEETTRSEKNVMGPLRNAAFTVNGLEMTTDDKGIAVDQGQVLLSPFDDLGASELQLTIVHADMGTLVLKVNRNMVQRFDPLDVRHQQLLQADVLVAMGFDYQPERSAGREGLSARVSCPEQVRPGEEFSMTIVAVNKGKKPISSLLYRTFSRHSWLHGRHLYVGTLKPGQSQTFERLFTVPDDVAPGTCYFAAGAWDILGAMPQGHLPLRLTVAGPAK